MRIGHDEAISKIAAEPLNPFSNKWGQDRRTEKRSAFRRIPVLDVSGVIHAAEGASLFLPTLADAINHCMNVRTDPFVFMPRQRQSLLSQDALDFIRRKALRFATLPRCEWTKGYGEHKKKPFNACMVLAYEIQTFTRIFLP